MDAIESVHLSNEFNEWLRSSNLTEYAEKFKGNGFDDLDLLKSMDEGEISSMIEDLGIEKRGHIMKLKKCLSWLKAPVSVRPNVSKLHHTASKKLVQTTLTLRKGQFVVEKGTTAVPPCSWQKFLKPHPKTDKMRFYNSITKEIYESAYVTLQTRFATYLNRQQQFRWDVTERIRRLRIRRSKGICKCLLTQLLKMLVLLVEPLNMSSLHVQKVMNFLKCSRKETKNCMMKKMK